MRRKTSTRFEPAAIRAAARAVRSSSRHHGPAFPVGTLGLKHLGRLQELALRDGAVQRSLEGLGGCRHLIADFEIEMRAHFKTMRVQ